MNRMIFAITSCALAGFCLARAQVTAGLTLSQDQFLPGESIPVSVRITNFSGQTLDLGQDNSWLQFTIEATTGYPVAKVSNPKVQGVFALTNAMVATKHIDVATHFEALRAGRYLLTAYVQIPGADSKPITARREFDVINGTVLWQQVFGLPSQSGDKGTPEVRRYALQQAIHLKQMKLYAAITDQSGGRVFRVFPLGPMLTFSEPEQQIDEQSRLHVLYQFGARSFYYYILNPDGGIVLRQIHDYSGPSRPKLRVDSNGAIVVAGGARRISVDDLPAVEEQSSDVTGKVGADSRSLATASLPPA